MRIHLQNSPAIPNAITKANNYRMLTAMQKNQFHTWILLIAKSRSQKATLQLFSKSLAAEWKGLSTRGMDIMGIQATHLCRRTYSRQKNKRLQERDASVNTLLHQSSWILWFDNFNKYFKKSHLKMFQLPYKVCAWTAVGLSKIPASQFNWLVHDFHPATGVVTHAFPTKIFTRTLITLLLDFAASYNTFRKNRMWAQSTATAHQVFNTPLRIQPANQTQEDLITGSRIGLRHFIPLELLDSNVSTVPGFCKSLRFIRQKYWKPNHYLILKLDYDLYWKFAKVSYHY